MHAENRRLRRVEDRRRQQRAKHAAVGDTEGAASEVVEREADFFGAQRKVGDGSLNHRSRFGLRPTQNRDYQATGSGDSDTNVNVVVPEDVITVNRGVNDRKLFHRYTHSTHEEGHVTEFDPVFDFEFGFVALAQFVHSLHVDFIKGGEHRGSVLGCDQTLGDTAAQA